MVQWYYHTPYYLILKTSTRTNEHYSHSKVLFIKTNECLNNLFLIRALEIGQKIKFQLPL